MRRVTPVNSRSSWVCWNNGQSHRFFVCMFLELNPWDTLVSWLEYIHLRVHPFFRNLYSSILGIQGCSYFFGQMLLIPSTSCRASCCPLFISLDMASYTTSFISWSSLRCCSWFVLRSCQTEKVRQRVKHRRGKEARASFSNSRKVCCDLSNFLALPFWSSLCWLVPLDVEWSTKGSWKK